MTEDDAKTKWCPFVRIITYENEIIDNRAGSSATYGDPYCIGSACMAWRWRYEQRKGVGQPVAANTVYSATQGYCGLAGKL